MKRIRGALVSGFAAVAVLASGQALARPVTIVTPFDKGSSPSAPLKADTQGLLTVDAYLNGQGPLRFILDTGANRSVVSRRIAEAYGLPLEAEADVHGVTGIRTAPMVRVETLIAGGVTLKNVKLPVLDEELLGSADGMLGMEAMADKRLEIDNAARAFSLRPSNEKSLAPQWRRLPATFRFNSLAFVTGRVGATPVEIAIDTGAERTLANEQLARAISGKVTQAQPGTKIASAAEAVAPSGVIRLDSIQIGDALRVRNVAVFVGDFPVFALWGLDDRPAMLLGMDVLQSMRAFAIDYARQEVQFRVN